jgi:signal-transduction protein with cAMP-binding, CBS, and nucleotidyltransferase domain
MRFATIGSLLTGSHGPSFIAPSASASDAAKLMKSRNAGALVVMHDSDAVGIVCKADIVDDVVARHRDPDATPVSELSRPVECVERSATIDGVWSRMIRASLGYVAVRDIDHVIGIVSRLDIMQWMIRSQEEEVDCAIGAVKRLAFANRRAD